MSMMIKATIPMFITTILCLSLPSGLGAQVMEPGSGNFSFGYGANNIAKSFVKGLKTTKTTEEMPSGSGPFTFAYQYGVTRKLAIGAQVNYQNGKSSPIYWAQQDSSGATGTAKYTMYLRLYTFLVKVDYHYSKGKIFDIYSGASAGYGAAKVLYSGTEDPKAIKAFGPLKGFGYSINALGVRLMCTKRIGAYAEFGYGVLGIANFGISIKTDDKKM